MIVTDIVLCLSVALESNKDKLSSLLSSMPVRLRLALHGRRHNKIFHIVAMNQRSARNSRPIETLGIYDPRLPLGQTYKTIEWSVDRLKWWLERGALPSKPVVKLLTLVSFNTIFVYLH